MIRGLVFDDSNARKRQVSRTSESSASKTMPSRYFVLKKIYPRAMRPKRLDRLPKSRSAGSLSLVFIYTKVPAIFFIFFYPLLIYMYNLYVYIRTCIERERVKTSFARLRENERNHVTQKRKHRDGRELFSRCQGFSENVAVFSSFFFLTV